VLSDTRGFIALAGKDAPASLRRETDAAPITSLHGQGFIGAVSGTGRRVAYWVANASDTRELRVFDATAPDQDAAMLSLLQGERIPAATVRSSGTAVLGVMNGVVIRVWSIASYADHRELGANPGDRIAFARWRPGATDIVVSIADRLELWPAAGGDHRVVARG